jgi:hypothetical protein
VNVHFLGYFRRWHNVGLATESKIAIIVSSCSSSKEQNMMQGPTRERWQELCAQAAEEQDPEKLLELVKEINRLLEEKEKRLAKLRKQSATAAE